MKFKLFAVLLLVFVAMPAMAQHDRFNDPDYPGVPEVSPYYLVGTTWYFSYHGVAYPVLDMHSLSAPMLRWVIDRLAENRAFAADMFARVDRWEFLAVSCSARECGISFNSVSPGINGGAALGFPVSGDATRIGPRGLLGLGSRKSVGTWKIEFFIADKRVREELLTRALYSPRS